MSTAKATPAAPGVTDEDRAAVAGLPQHIVKAWAAHDADAFADAFTEDATMILPGLYRKGRDEIRSYMATAFAGTYRGTRVTGRPIDARFLGEDTGVVVTRGGVLAPGETEVSRERSILATWVVVRDNGAWRIAAYHNSPSDAA